MVWSFFRQYLAVMARMMLNAISQFQPKLLLKLIGLIVDEGKENYYYGR